MPQSNMNMNMNMNNNIMKPASTSSLRIQRPKENISINPNPNIPDPNAVSYSTSTQPMVLTPVDAQIIPINQQIPLIPQPQNSIPSSNAPKAPPSALPPIPPAVVDTTDLQDGRLHPPGFGSINSNNNFKPINPMNPSMNFPMMNNNGMNNPMMMMNNNNNQNGFRMGMRR